MTIYKVQHISSEVMMNFFFLASLQFLLAAIAALYDTISVDLMVGPLGGPSNIKLF